MTTTLQVDERLLIKAVRLGKHRTREAAVNQALTEYIQHLEQLKILQFFGTIDYDPDYDYKEQRGVKNGSSG